MQRDIVRYRAKKADRETEQIYGQRERACREKKADIELKKLIKRPIRYTERENEHAQRQSRYRAKDKYKSSSADKEPRRDTQTEDIERQSKI